MKTKLKFAIVPTLAEVVTIELCITKLPLPCPSRLKMVPDGALNVIFLTLPPAPEKTVPPFAINLSSLESTPSMYAPFKFIGLLREMAPFIS